MPYGLASAPYWWGEFIQRIIDEISTSTSTVIRYYYDDIIIASKSVTDHHQIVLKLFQALKKNGLSISEEKLQLASDKVTFLGYEISADRIAIEPSKIEAIRKWELPTTKESILKLVGFINYLRNFIPEASEHLRPFYAMIDPKIHTTLPHVKEITHTSTPPLNHLKEWIARSLTLKLFDPTAPTVIFSDASLTGGASIIFQPEIHNNKQTPISNYITLG
ncbi:Tkp3 protein [Vanderwaltozyma polyspora DSM 70294]|uniref:Tkp3 protein n=1 Tax=Vanderwaltozyma polyspora (strain ATCC 22028 / DSM 70294 / BCRC 21397 / CBS 2163 / NBRC 10782 / NRRL Y-8283 / UCD 57-17) TaxID=436907 RepID=A7TTB2_VANPO|nr:Tkp3 protein [Vanderwaltozyma polyspora DSM 70294]EDO14494.1 Tkp3 protein [Vanderwaltozyma polyspora DSM 70294]